MAKRSHSYLGPLVTPGRLPVLFVLGIIVLSLFSAAIYDLAKEWLTTPIAILLLSIGLLIFLLIVNQAWVRFVRPKLESTPEIKPRPGLLVLVSQGRFSESPALGAVRYHYKGEKNEREMPTLKHCWLVTSPREPEKEDDPLKDPPLGEPYLTAWENTLKLQGFLQQNGGVQVVVHIVEVDPNDAEDVYEKVTAAMKQAERLGLSDRQIVADITGGTKVMTAGMTLAAVAAGGAVEYMVARELNEKGRAISGAGAYPVMLNLQYTLGADTSD
ncbi:MAG: hypothetical protein R3C44_18625 [Chloroflexota bacterium]